MISEKLKRHGEKTCRIIQPALGLHRQPLNCLLSKGHLVENVLLRTASCLLNPHFLRIMNVKLGAFIILNGCGENTVRLDSGRLTPESSPQDVSVENVTVVGLCPHILIQSSSTQYLFHFLYAKYLTLGRFYAPHSKDSGNCLLFKHSDPFCLATSK